MSEKRGLEWNILAYRIANDIVFSKLIGKVDPLKDPFVKESKSQRAISFVKVLLFGIALIAANCFVFVQFRQPNLFEYMGLSRVCTDRQIDAAYDRHYQLLDIQARGYRPSASEKYQNSLRIRELNEIRDILKNNARRIIYDKHGITEAQYGYYLTPNFMITCILQTGINFLILLISSITGTKSGDKALIKWQVLLIINFFLLEVYTLKADQTQADWIDIAFPSLTIQHRIHFFKILLVPVSIIVSYLTQKFSENRKNEIALKLQFLKVQHYMPLYAISDKIANNPIPQRGAGISEEQVAKFEIAAQNGKQMQHVVKEQIDLVDKCFEIITQTDGSKKKGGFDFNSIMKFVVFAYLIYSQMQ